MHHMGSTCPKSMVVTYESKATIGKNSPPTYDIARKHEFVYNIVVLTYNIVYDVTYDVIRTIGKNSILTYDITYDVVHCTISEEEATEGLSRCVETQ